MLPFDELSQCPDAELSALLADMDARPFAQLSYQELQDAERQAQEKGFDWASDGQARLKYGGQVFNAGRFSHPDIKALRELCRPSGSPLSDSASPLRLFVLKGRHRLTDIAFQQQHADGETLFQLASQFNGLESPGPYLVPVSAYFSDLTQGPIGALQSYPGALLRHYAAPAPEGGVFEQSEARSLNFLEAALPLELAEVQHGYLLAEHIPDPEAALRHLQAHLQDFQIGLHRHVQVPLSHTGQPVALALCSTLAAPYSQGETQSPVWRSLMGSLLEAGYTGTLLSALAYGYRRVVLTAIGGGVFGNPHDVIWRALLRSFDSVRAYAAQPLEVWLNLWAFDVSDGELAQGAQDRRGRLIRLG